LKKERGREGKKEGMKDRFHICVCVYMYMCIHIYMYIKCENSIAKPTKNCFKRGWEVMKE
jgi:hypothetical protein